MESPDRRPASVDSTTGPIKALAAWLETGEPHEYRGPFSRWPRTTDAIISLAVFSLSVVSVALSALEDGADFTLGSIGDPSVGTFVLLGVSASALWWRRSHALEVTAFLLAVTVLWALAGYGDGQDLALLVAIYSVGRYCTDNRQSVAALAAVVAISILGFVIDSNQRIDIAPAIALSALPWYVGLRIRNRGEYLLLLRDRATRLEAEQLARARQAVADERSRIARELHDVVAHQVSMMTVQAGAAKTVARKDISGAIEAMGYVEEAGRKALGELRHLLGVLRPDAEEADVLLPQPGIEGIADLVDELTHTGARVVLEMADLPDDLPTAVDLSVYRIVQESLTNVIKHAGASPSVEVTITREGHQLAIEITNTTATDAPGSGPAPLPDSGFGITGMRERAALLGGTLSAGPRAPDEFCVHVTLPLELEPR